MGDPLQNARDAGDVPQAPAFLGWSTAMGTSTGLSFGVADANWPALANAAWGMEGMTPTLEAVHDVVVPCVIGSVVGSMVGLMIGAAAMGTLAPGLRIRTQNQSGGRGLGFAALFAIALGALFLPGLMAKLGDGDPGRLLAYAPLCALFLGALVVAPVAFYDRIRAIRKWRARLRPKERPRRDPDAIQPQLKAALNRRIHAVPIATQALSVVIAADEYAVGLIFAEGRAPLVSRHGDYLLRREAIEAGIGVIENPLLARTLAGIPTGSPAPESTWTTLIQISRERGLNSGPHTDAESS